MGFNANAICGRTTIYRVNFKFYRHLLLSI